MSFKESFETVSKEEALKEVISSFRNEEEKLNNTILPIIKEQATDENTREQSLKQIFQDNNPDVSDLITKYGIDVNYSKKQIKVSIKTDIGGQQKEYEIVITKEGVKAKGLIDTERNDIDNTDQKYNADTLDKTIQKIKEWLYKRTGNDATSEILIPKIDEKLNATKKVFKALFQNEIK